MGVCSKSLNTMKQLKIYPLLILFLIIISCDNEEIEISTTSGNAHLTSKLEDGKVSGFSFEQNGVIILTESNKVDFMVLTLTNESGTPIGSFLSSPNLDTEFASLKPGEESIDSDVFESLVTIPDSVSNWSNSTAIKAGEIWFVRTRQDKFGKLLFHEVIEITDRGGTGVFSSATFEWVFQPNGTQNF